MTVVGRATIITGLIAGGYNLANNQLDRQFQADQAERNRKHDRDKWQYEREKSEKQNSSLWWSK